MFVRNNVPTNKVFFCEMHEFITLLERRAQAVPSLLGQCESPPKGYPACRRVTGSPMVLSFLKMVTHVLLEPEMAACALDTRCAGAPSSPLVVSTGMNADVAEDHPPNHPAQHPADQPALNTPPPTGAQMDRRKVAGRDGGWQVTLTD